MIKTVDLKHYSKNELKTMNTRGDINYCPSCRKYHVEDKPRWPLYNISQCPKCKEDNKMVQLMLDTV